MSSLGNWDSKAISGQKMPLFCMDGVEIFKNRQAKCWLIVQTYKILYPYLDKVLILILTLGQRQLIFAQNHIAD